jgi:alkylation response protein AidB-like acyl-CoA dehydrogenase
MLGKWLQENVPNGDSDGIYNGAGPRICHGDFRVDNIIFDKNDCNKILAVIDWELSSIGDPSADLAYCMIPHYLPSVGYLRRYSLLSIGVGSVNGFTKYGIPTVQELISRYKSNVGITTDPYYPPAHSSKNWTYYIALSMYRMASIAQGVMVRGILGNASRGRREATLLGEVVPILAREAFRLIEGAAGFSGCKENVRVGAASVELKGVEVVGFSISPLAKSLFKALRIFNDNKAIPVENELIKYYMNAEGTWPQRGKRWVHHEKMDALSKTAKEMGLWNLWMSEALVNDLKAHHPDWPWEREILPHAAGLSNVDYAYLAIESGRCLFTPSAINCSAPDTGNMEIIAKFGTASQRNYWLLPLLLGQIRSCFAMTEPNVASSDPTQLAATAVLSVEADANPVWSVNGLKWWTTGACDSRCKCCIFVARTDSTPVSTSSDNKVAERLPHEKHTLFLFPFTLPGIDVIRPLTVFGYDDAPHGHAEVKFDHVQVKDTRHESGESGVLGVEGKGFDHAQSR